MPPGSTSGVHVTGRTESREDIEIGVVGAGRESLIGMDDKLPAALLAEGVGGKFTQRLGWVSLASNHEGDFVQGDATVGIPNLKIRGVVTGTTVRSGEGDGERLADEVGDGGVAFQEEDKDALKLRLELDEPTTLVRRHAAAITIEADDPPDVAGRGFTREGHTKPP